MFLFLFIYIPLQSYSKNFFALSQTQIVIKKKEKKKIRITPPFDPQNPEPSKQRRGGGLPALISLLFFGDSEADSEIQPSAKSRAHPLPMSNGLDRYRVTLAQALFRISLDARETGSARNRHWVSFLVHQVQITFWTIYKLDAALFDSQTTFTVDALRYALLGRIGTAETTSQHTGALAISFGAAVFA